MNRWLTWWPRSRRSGWRPSTAELAAEVLAEEERAAEDQLLQAQRSTSAGLPVLFAAPPEDSGVVVDFRTAEYGVIPARRAS